ncbi:MAG: endonuclease/exonuclease/phosphatase family protein [Treponema sp.]|jgi:endonuclease/exonuclease/phosphatase family metal-dependent hydrolase|nr:endonuclease/exonuclease/phosphatase family protein [Treponema sp.]
MNQMDASRGLYRYQFLKGVALFLILSFWGGCRVLGTGSGSQDQENPGLLTLVTWNVQALFDGDESGIEYDTYLQTAGWTDEKYRARLNSLAQAIDRMDGKAPDILGLEEIENIQVLEDLLGGPLANCGYTHLYFAHNPGASLGIGVLSRFPLEETRVHSITDQGETVPRPLVEVRFSVQNQPLVLFVCHWKAKQGNKKPVVDTEFLRRASARILLRRLQELRHESPDIPVIVMGDLNENHDEWYREAGTAITALLPDDPKAVELTGLTIDAEIYGASPEKASRDFLILSGNKPPKPAYFPAAALVLYSPWGRELQEGSYYYQGRWETIDHFLLTEPLFDRKGWDFDTCMVINQEPFITTQGRPYAYNPRTGNGLSDHLPLLLTLKLAPAQDEP